MAFNSEKVLLKQITDLTRQIEVQKKGFSSKGYQTKTFAKPWVKNSTSTFSNSFSKGSRHWQKPSVLSGSAGQPGVSTLGAKPPSNSIQIVHDVHSKVPVFDNVKTKSNVFVNPNFVPGTVATNVHVNPNFRSRTPASRAADSAALLAGTSSTGSVPSVAPPPVPPVVSFSGSTAGPTVPPAAVASVLVAGPSLPPAAGPPGSAASPGVLPAAGPSGSVAGPSVPPAAGASGRTRRRSRSLSSLSSRYRLITARKLVRRLSKDAKTPPAPAANRRPTFHTRHKLVRVASTPRSQHQANKLVSTRHKLVRVASTPRTQHHVNKLTTYRAAGLSWPARRSGAAQQRTTPRPGPAASRPASRFKLVRTAAAAAPGPVRSQHRTWKRRSSTSSSGARLTPSSSRLTSAGSLRLGSTRFVNIGGILYKSTARKLQRANPKPAQLATNVGKAAPSPRWISVRGARYRVEAGGRSLRRLDQGPPAPPRLDIGGLTFRRGADGTLTADRRHQVNRTLLSRAKSRSLAVLRDTLRLSRQPCRFFCRLGRCQRHVRGQCPHVHDPALRPVCTRHLQGGCRRPGCAYNHAPRPEKVPHCLHFLTAECRRDPCPYQHVNVDADAPLCARFLAGFCARGQQCTEKHLYICPEFSEDGTCPRGAACPLAHRARRRRRRSVRATPAAAPVAPPRGTGRYYLSTEAGVRPDAPPADRDGDGDGERPAMTEMPSFIAIDDQSSGDEA